jgi:hypothetical protein
MKEYNITMTDEEIPYDYIHEKIYGPIEEEQEEKEKQTNVEQ